MRIGKTTLAMVIAMVALFAIFQIVWSQPTPPIGNPSPPEDVAKPQQMTEIQKAEWNARLEREGKVEYLSGPKTMGKAIHIAGKKVQLPSDAYVDGYITEVECAQTGPCPDDDELPLLAIARGNSLIYITKPSGKVVFSKIALGEEAAFEFLKGVMRK